MKLSTLDEVAEIDLPLEIETRVILELDDIGQNEEWALKEALEKANELFQGYGYRHGFVIVEN